VDFQTATDFVSLDFIGSNTGTDPDEIGIGRMFAYDSGDALLATVTTDQVGGLLFNEVQTLTIARPTPDIAYIQARRLGDNAVAVDHLVYNEVPEPATLAVCGLALAGLAGYTRRRRRA
jgi:hypothetical protein